MASDDRQSDTHLLRPEDVTEELPVAVRGYDRHAVDRRLARLADSYALLQRQRDELRGWLDAAEARVAAAEDEAKVSARQLATLAQREASAADELVASRRRVSELERSVEEARASQSEVAPPVSTIPEGKAAELLLAARAASEQLRRNAREEARLVLRKARSRADEVGREAERQHRLAETEAARIATLAARAEEQRRAADDAAARVTELSARADAERRAASEAEARRVEAERQAAELLAHARAEAEQALAAIASERQRVQSMLGRALEALDAEGQAGDVLADLSARLPGGD